MSSCQVINHTPAGYALRQSDAHPANLRIGELIALKVEGRIGVQVAIVRWFRNTLKTSGLEFGCELIADEPEAAAAAREGAATPLAARGRRSRGSGGPAREPRERPAAHRARPPPSSSSRRSR